MKLILEQGKLVQWKNEFGQQNVWLITQDSKGVVIHTETSLPVGTYMDISEYEVVPFVGTVNLHSKVNN